ncbi:MULTISPECIES: hypothetical protein [Helicobacter]|uniref:Outer membrane beta-barrel protein n=1 Tax=Helicobacter ibis TaxID=2962633 RepID=A0ABT4VC51_9HELI|nr:MULTISPECIES: hypothetical protein [Helicobacter]MDA3967539.1 hypothetical protein [Helicobacter sp. WB40]MDA3968287.1 hypothetical protein [Helicobacter ibis]
MKRILSALLLSCMLISTLYAYNQGANSYSPLYTDRKNKLVGVYSMVGRVSSDSTLSIEGFESQKHSLKETPIGFGVQVGYLLSENHRLLLNYEQFLKKHGFSHQLLTLGYAITPLVPNTQNLRLLLGLNVGVVMASFDSGSFTINDSSMGGLDFMGTTYGVKGGFLYNTGAGEIEFGIQARKLDLGVESGEIAVNNAPTKSSLDLSDTSSTNFFLGYNFLF